MLFLSKGKDKNPKNNAARQPSMMRSGLRFAFNPEIGANLRPLQESIAMFVNLLAVIFISQGMFPANHPAYLGRNGERLTLRLLLSEVWKDLKFSKETLPQLLLFFTLIIGLGFAAIAFVVIIVSILGTVFVAKAHADSYFVPPGGADDIAAQWVSFLFNAGAASSWAGLFSNDPLAASGAIQAALVTALGFYSDAILVVAAVVLFYHLTAMTVETAHHGVVMGKEANQIWAPIRLVVAIGLLVPIAGGLNSGQFIVVQITQWGTGLASNVWGIFLTSMAANSMGVSGIPPYARNTVYNTLATETCNAAYGAHDGSGSGGGGISSTNRTFQPAADPMNPQTATTGQIATTDRGAQQRNDVANSRRCGHNSFNQTGQAAGSDSTASAMQSYVQSTSQSCYDQMQQQAQQYAQKESKYFTSPDFGGNSNKDTPANDGQFASIVSEYMSCLAGGLPIPSLLGVFAQSLDWGWVSAGAALSAIAQAQADANNLSALIPETQIPDFSGQGGDPNMKKASEVVAAVEQHIRQLAQGGGAGGGGGIGTDTCAAQRGTLMQQAEGLAQEANAKDHFLDRILEVIDWIAGWNCVWNSNSNYLMGIQFTGANPLAEMAQLGHAMINTAYDTFDMYVNLSASEGANAAGRTASASQAENGGSLMNLNGQALQGKVTAIGGILLMITNVFFVTGILLAYYVPLIPFITFLFGVLAWVVSVLEAVVCVPMIALAHLNPKGDGLPGPSAKVAYFFVFNIFLRPVLMVFGLIFGLLVFYAAVSYMNVFYMMAVATAGGLADGHLLLSRMVYSGIYVIILYICANSCFKTINFIPEHVIKWLGQQSLHFQHMGEAQQVAGPLMQGAGNISAVTGAMKEGGWGAAQSLQGKGGFMSTIASTQKLSQAGGGGGATQATAQLGGGNAQPTPTQQASLTQPNGQADNTTGPANDPNKGGTGFA